MNEQSGNGRQQAVLWGAILIGIGLLSVVGRMLNIGVAFMPLVGLLILAIGMFQKNIALIVAGGPLTGVGLGIFLISGPLQLVPESAHGGIFMLCFGLGWLLITPLAYLVSGKLAWWPVFAGAIVLLIGGAGLGFGFASNILIVLSQIWPLIVIAFGIYVLIARRQRTH